MSGTRIKRNVLILGNDKNLDEITQDNLPDGFITIGINRSFLKVKTDFLFFNDIEIFQELIRHGYDFNKTKVISSDWLHWTSKRCGKYRMLRPYLNPGKIKVFSRINTLKYPDSVTTAIDIFNKYIYNDSSTYDTTYYIAGTSLTYDKKQNHFWTGKYGTFNNKNEEWYVLRFEKTYDNFKKLKNSGVKIVSVTPNSKINNLFQYISYSQLSQKTSKLDDIKENSEPNNMIGNTIIIPAYNAKQFINECVSSVRESISTSGTPSEIIIGIDGCLDTLEYIIANKDFYKGIRVFYFNKNGGTYATRNSLIKYATFNNILFFDADDIMEKNMVSNFSQNIKTHDVVRFSYYDFIGSHTDVKQLKIIKCAHGVFGVRRSIFEELNGFYNWTCGADTEFMYRCKFRNKTTHVVGTQSFFRRIHPTSLTVRKDTGFKSPMRNQYIELINQKQRQNKFDNPAQLHTNSCYEITL